MCICAKTKEDREAILTIGFEGDYITLDNLFITQIFYEGNSPVDAQFGRLSRNIAEAHRDKKNLLRERIDKEGARVRMKNIRHRKKLNKLGNVILNDELTVSHWLEIIQLVKYTNQGKLKANSIVSF